MKTKIIPQYDLLEKKDFHEGVHHHSEGHKKIFERIRNYLIKNKIIKC